MGLFIYTMESRIFSKEEYWQIEDSLNKLFESFPNMEIVSLTHNTVAQGEYNNRVHHSVIIIFKPN